jgi:Fic family protein
VATEASETIAKLLTMFERHRQKIHDLRKSAASALRVHDLLKERVFLSVGTAQKELKLTFPTVSNAMENLEKLGIIKEFTGKQRNRLFSYDPCLQLLTDNTTTSKPPS